jgi:acetoin utilization protein AcuC
LAALFAGGTLQAIELLLKGDCKIAIHFPGAKHHAQYDHSSGFCVFADLAIAADIATKDYGKKVAILDIDAHHGDGTENLTADNPAVLSFSIHQYGIFPGTGFEDIPEKNVYNFPLYPTHPNQQLGMGDSALFHGALVFL